MYLPHHLESEFTYNIEKSRFKQKNVCYDYGLYGSEEFLYHGKNT